VRQVHNYVYLKCGDVEMFHHTGIKKPGMYERMYFNPPVLPCGHDDNEITSKQWYAMASANHQKINKWLTTNKTMFSHAKVLKVHIPVYVLSNKKDHPEAKTLYESKDSASPYEETVARIALEFATYSQSIATASTISSRSVREHAKAIEGVYVKGYKRY
jgi:hypothetical protein